MVVRYRAVSRSRSLPYLLPFKEHGEWVGILGEGEGEDEELERAIEIAGLMFGYSYSTGKKRFGVHGLWTLDDAAKAQCPGASLGEPHVQTPKVTRSPRDTAVHSTPYQHYLLFTEIAGSSTYAL